MKMRIRNITLGVFYIVIHLCSCGSPKSKEPTSTELEFFPLKNHLSINDSYYNIEEGRNELHIRERVLVMNPPLDKDSLVYMMLNYRKEYGIVINDSCKYYAISFYRYTKNTVPYIEQKLATNFWGEKYGLGAQKQDLLGIIYNTPSPVDSLKWMIEVAIAYDNVSGPDKYDPDLKADIYVLDSCATHYYLIE